MLKVAYSSVFVIFGFVCLSLYFYGSFITINSIYTEKNDCKMTFMFEHPNYVVSFNLIKEFIICAT